MLYRAENARIYKYTSSQINARKSKICLKNGVRMSKIAKKIFPVCIFISNFVAMKILDAIRYYFKTRDDNHILTRGGYVGGWENLLTCEQFGYTAYLNVVQLLTDLYNEVNWTLRFDTEKGRAWLYFVQRNGERILVELYTKQGYVVVCYKRDETGAYSFWQAKESEYTVTTTASGDTQITVQKKDVLYYVIKSPTYEATGYGDYHFCKPYVKLLNNVLNATNTISERLGTVVIGSPSTPAGAPMAEILTKQDKDEIEKEIQENYGSLRRQKIFMLLPKGMNFNTINLAGLDQRLQEKVKTALLFIADRIKVPANQIAFIDSTGGRSLANGTELREGETAKYRSFRRLLNHTFYDFATEIGLQVDYTIENEPRTVQGQTIENE